MDWRNISWPWQNLRRQRLPPNWSNWRDRLAWLCCRRELRHGVEIITLAVRPAIARNSEEEPLRVRKKIQTRQRIADAAATLFATKGFDAVTVAEIARLAEVSEQTVYNLPQQGTARPG